MDRETLKMGEPTNIIASSYFVEMFLWSAVGGLVLFLVLKRLLLFQRMPPGPYGLPVLGQLFHLMKVDAVEEFRNWRARYGDIFSFSCGGFYLAVINNQKDILEVSKREEFAGRPNFHIWDLRNMGKRNRGILFCDAGPVWQEQRRFALRSLRNFGFGKESMEGMILYEMNELIKRLRKEIGTPTSLSGSFNASVLNSLWSILSGKRYELDDPKFTDTITMLISNLKEVFLTFPGFFFPWPAKFNLIGGWRWRRAKVLRLKLWALIEEHIKQHKATYEEDVTRDFIDAFLHEIKNSGKDSSFYGDEGEFNLKIALLDLFVAGTETTSTTLLWAILYLTQNPEVQKKVHAEIDSVIGNKQPSRDDKPQMVYLEAFLNEVHRMCSLLPMSVYHRALKDGELRGHLIPKGTIIFLNINALHHDPKIWGDDHSIFKPERFLDSSGTKLIKHEALVPFGAGTRQCLGEPLARDTLFIFLSGLLQNFNFDIDPAMKDNVDLSGSPTFISSPMAFKVVITERRSAI